MTCKIVASHDLTTKGVHSSSVPKVQVTSCIYQRTDLPQEAHRKGPNSPTRKVDKSKQQREMRLATQHTPEHGFSCQRDRYYKIDKETDQLLKCVPMNIAWRTTYAARAKATGFSRKPPDTMVLLAHCTNIFTQKRFLESLELFFVFHPTYCKQ